MTKDTISFILALLLFSIILFGVHFYIIFQFFDADFYFPIWTIYVFNTLLVFIVYGILRYKSIQGSKNIYQTFLLLTLAKMALILVFLIPLFIGKSKHIQFEVFNFFIPYFLFLIFEIFHINKFLKKV